MTAKAGAVGRPKGGKVHPPPEERNDRETVIHMKGSPAYVDWLDAFHRATHIPKVQIVRLGLIKIAKKMGQPAPPEM